MTSGRGSEAVTRARRVLIADDDHSHRQLIMELFDASGCEIVTAVDGDSAMSLLLENTFDLAVLDYHLPGMGADGIMAQLNEAGSDLPVIVVTADDSIDTERTVRSFGPAYFFVKPLNLDDVRAVVARIFAHERKLRPRVMLDLSHITPPRFGSSHVQ